MQCVNPVWHLAAHWRRWKSVIAAVKYAQAAGARGCCGSNGAEQEGATPAPRWVVGSVYVVVVSERDRPAP